MLNKLLRVGEGRMVKRLDAIASHVETLSDDVEALTDAELRAKTDEFKERIADGASLDELLPESVDFAAGADSLLPESDFDTRLDEARPVNNVDRIVARILSGFDADVRQ